MGQHVVLGGETMYCIARGYGVLPGAIAQANGLSPVANVRAGQVLNIPAVQWVDISVGPVCPPQFVSLFPGLVVPTATPNVPPTQPGPPLVLDLEWHCIDNCGSDQGTYTVRVTLTASGGVQPYTYNPAQMYDVIFDHCTQGSGIVGVTSADGQQAVKTWTYTDVSCPPAP
jgi:LysM repeat protein